MPFLFEEYDTIRLTQGESCQIVRKFNQGHIMAMQDSVARGISLGADDTGKVTLREMNVAQMVNAGNYVSILIGVKSWTFKDQNGDPAPVTEEFIRLLDPADFEIIKAEVDKRNKEASARSDAEKEPHPVSNGRTGRARRVAPRA